MRIMEACFLVFALAAPPGFLLYDQTQDFFLPVIEQLKSDVLKDSKFDTAYSIFVNNYRVCAMLLVAGALVLPSLFILSVNGFLVGFVLKYVLAREHSLSFFIKGVLLHSLFELPAIFLSAAIGIRIGLSFMTLDNRKRAKDVSRSLREALTIHFFVVIPLLVVAALIETFVSAALIT